MSDTSSPDGLLLPIELPRSEIVAILKEMTALIEDGGVARAAIDIKFGERSVKEGEQGDAARIWASWVIVDAAGGKSTKRIGHIVQR